MSDAVKPAAASIAPLSFRELVALTAAVMALNAFAIDMMLPALGVIAGDLGAPGANDRQLLIVVYILGNGVAQLFFGPIVDRFGRRRVLLWSLAAYIAGSALSVIASSFALLLYARVFQGIATAATRVAIIASVRDQVSGRRMAELMSLAITVFMAAPIIAPGLGQLILFALPWRGIFFVLLAYGAAIFVWAALRLPETLPAENRHPLSARRIAAAYATFASNRVSMGYTLVSALCFGALFGFISSSEQLFLETYRIGDAFALFFGIIAGALGCATLVNARLVNRFGMRRLTHGALIVFVGANVMHFGLVTGLGDHIVIFVPFTAASFFALGLIGPNCSALAMEPMGRIAGAAAAANGFFGTTVAGAVGGAIGRLYDGGSATVVAGFLGLGVAGLALAFWIERGRLFEPGRPDPVTLEREA